MQTSSGHLLVCLLKLFLLDWTLGPCIQSWSIYCKSKLMSLLIMNQRSEPFPTASSVLFSEELKPIFSTSPSAFSGRWSSAGDFVNASTCEEFPSATCPPGQTPPILQVPLKVSPLTKNFLIHFLSPFGHFLPQPGKISSVFLRLSKTSSL